MKKSLLLPALLCPVLLVAQNLTPEITSWIINPGGETGYNGLPSNVQQVQYSADNVYVSATCIPGYDIGPWAGNPNTPANQNFVFKITRHPMENTAGSIATGLGHIGIWTNGVSIFNPKDGVSWQNQNIWRRNAIIAEGPSFDNCLGHPAPNGEYHNHLNPTCLYDDTDWQHHSPIVGFAFDGFPVYGCYGFANADGTGGLVRIKSSYQKRGITERTTLPDGTQLAANQYGPAINNNYPLGLYLEDFEYVPGLGDLDEHNGRFCITPEYPNGIYAYFITLENTGVAAYPYIIGPTYFGVVQPGNTGPQSGHNTPSEPVIPYTPTTAAGAPVSDAGWTLFPNPASDYFQITGSMPIGGRLELRNALGQTLRAWENAAPDDRFLLDGIAPGQYLLLIRTAEKWVGRTLSIR